VKLQLHVGTEKTGSSYLQKLCARNREFLRENGIWFPDAGRFEKQLQRGTISSGNARDLARHIQSFDWAAVSSWISTRANDAEAKGCGRLLLSHELIFAAMSHEGAVEQFQRVAGEAGISDISCLMMIRDPVDHALSLYKHRAKGGKAGAVERWITQGYPLPSQLAKFLRQIDSSAVRLQLRKYEKSTGAIVTAFFHDWLEVSTPPNHIESLVNPSLSLSELALIRHVTATRPIDREAFYSSFLSVPLNMKADDGIAKSIAMATIESFLCQFNEFWKELDARLATDGGLKIPQKRERDIVNSTVPQYVFGEEQLRAWTQAHAESLSPRYAVNHWVRASLRPRVGKLIRKFVPRFRKE